ncbi:histidinol dehydrogenase [Clostridium tagluense]|uniref:histidinol dehydrogenase n=1 Tax=Clostridium tagluense TaxID=360422 RepID=UPI001C0CC6AB|nr:histidinol dehydrogenase [Clostridium tagluense]MBU3130230.1 histidinol dehydrogenase [Clostridium tagluense]MBW9159058.1 histidinol dehydrogenase [Clostridium tagluense]MCB2313848.1 histidinol dehydrogenase [Clostridium tagluense]MCB2318671.1 histidinol dehydrogenase [Clostridium tagluense]MCB2323540.1 histidinol dehydrogenase [Clostridium tagluense]
MMKITEANSNEGKEYIEFLKKRAEDVQNDVNIVVDKILQDIKTRGDDAIIEYTKKFDSKLITLENIIVTATEIKNAYKMVDKDFLEAITLAKQNVREFHEKQVKKPWMMKKEKGVVLGQTVRGLESVGIYVPGGTAAYPSTVIMNAIPAKVAGVKNLVMVTPPTSDGSVNPHILVAADIAGVDQIYKVGGAQAIAALAFGTETISKVDKIVGPGNIYVAMAKKNVFGYVDIDMIAGPSEILIIADENSNEKYIAADLMSQAEHDVLASAMLITTSRELADKVVCELGVQIKAMSRKDIISESLERYGVILIVQNIKEAIDLANKIAPEHLEVLLDNPFDFLGDIKNAGSIFLGRYSPEPLGDYIAGPNHVLPTSGSARFFSPLSVDDFIKKSSYIYYTKEALSEVADKVIKLAEVEGLTAHGNSIKVRLES